MTNAPDGVRKVRGIGRLSSDAPTLQTERLVLRPIAVKDVNALLRISNEPGVRRFLWDDGSVAEATIRDLVSGSARMFAEEGIGLFGVRRSGDENLIGFCGFVRLEGLEEAELAYELTQRAWGEGLATEASLACLGHAFENANLERVLAGADPGNVASLRVIQKLGMRPVGNINAEAPEVPYHAVYREEYRANQGRSKGWR